MLLLLTAVSAVSCAAHEAQPADLEARARAFLSALAQDDLDAAAKDFDAAMNKTLPSKKLGNIWMDMAAKGGAFKKLGDARLSKVDKYDIVTVRCEFALLAYDARVVIDADKQITGLFFQQAFEYKEPPYVNRDGFTERDLQVGAGEWRLPATLTVPKGDGPFAAVVLLHGSGPQDRDETIGPNKPFRDLAGGLASQGVAVLRFEKRTKAYGAKLARTKTLTVKEDILDDALAAVALLRKTQGIAPKKIFVLGHSMGGMAAPRLGQLDGDIAGLIVMAGGARPIEEVIIEQMDYLLSLEMDAPEKEKAKVEVIKKTAARLTDPNLARADLESTMLLGANFVYWRSVRDLRPTETAAKIQQPMFILQGERDYQATLADFELWKKALTDRPNVTLKSYPKLNHLFMEGAGKARPTEYEKEGHVAAEVIDAIATWVKKR
jgi:dienelactone hydrolase